MKDTGVIRRIDDLGRIVIPKEIRRTLKIREGDSLEIFVDSNGSVVLKKFSPLGELSNLAKLYSGATSKNADKVVIVTDMEKVIATSKSLEKKLEDKPISNELLMVIESKTAKVIPAYSKFPLTTEYVYDGYIYIEPIIVYGDIMGAIIMLDDNQIDEPNKNIVRIGSMFLGEYISS